MLKKDSKPCPKCSTVIHKIDGCDQMWCPCCKSAFSWLNGVIETRIHNPHYYEYLRNTKGYVPRDPLDQPDECELPVFPKLLLNNREHESIDTYAQYFRLFVHVLTVLRPQWGPDVIDKHIGEHELKFLRVEYICKDSSYGNWKWKLQKRYKAARKCREISQVFDTIKHVGLELFWDKESDVNDMIERIENAIKFFNDAFGIISKRFNCIVPVFTGTTCITEKYHS